MKLSLEKFTQLADQLVDEIPPRLCRNLNGGFSVSPQKVQDGEFYTMGEYIEGGFMGCLVVIYYGSFAALLADEPYEVWEAELRDTIWHELRHHLESAAGIDDLTREEMEELRRYLQE